MIRFPLQQLLVNLVQYLDSWSIVLLRRLDTLVYSIWGWDYSSYHHPWFKFLLLFEQKKISDTNKCWDMIQRRSSNWSNLKKKLDLKKPDYQQYRVWWKKNATHVPQNPQKKIVKFKSLFTNKNCKEVQFGETTQRTVFISGRSIRENFKKRWF